jgi:hypothetical protein
MRLSAHFVPKSAKPTGSFDERHQHSPPTWQNPCRGSRLAEHMASELKDEFDLNYAWKATS